MPAGNDFEGNAQWNERMFRQYGVHGNAADLIHHAHAVRNIAVEKALLVRTDDDATEEAMGDLPETAEKFGDQIGEGETLVSAAVHGNAVVGVLEHDESGNTRKVVAGWNDKYVAPKLPPQEEKRIADAQQHLAFAAEINRLREEHDAEMASLRADMQAQIEETLQEVRRSALAPAAPAEDETTSPEPPTPPSKPTAPANPSDPLMEGNVKTVVARIEKADADMLNRFEAAALNENPNRKGVIDAIAARRTELGQTPPG